MATGPLLDFDALLTPIPGDNPAGAALRYAGDYDELKGLLPKPDRDAFEASGQEGQWGKLVQLSTQKLHDKSKDLAIAAWLTEGLVHQHGFAGFRDGLVLIRRLCDEFWESIYPLPDEGDWEVRAAPLQSLLERNGSLWVAEIPLTKAPLRSPDADELIPVTYNLWHAIVVAQLEDKKLLAGAMEHADLRVGRSQAVGQLARSIGRVVVHHQHVVIQIAHGADHRLQVVPLVEGRKDHQHVGRHLRNRILAMSTSASTEWRSGEIRLGIESYQRTGISAIR